MKFVLRASTFFKFRRPKLYELGLGFGLGLEGPGLGLGLEGLGLSLGLESPGLVNIPATLIHVGVDRVMRALRPGTVERAPTSTCI